MSTIYHYNLEQLDAIGVTDLSISYRSLEPDTASLRLPMGEAAASPVPWMAGDRIILTDERVEGEPRLFNGRVKKVRTVLAATSYAIEVELANDVDVLSATTFAYIDDDGEVQYAQSFYDARAEGESTEGERITSCRTVCERCFEWAIGGGALDCTLELQFDATIMGVAGTGSQSCWSLIRTALKWVPDACTAMRYSSAGDTLQFLTSRDMAPVVLDVARRRVTGTAGTYLVSFESIVSCELTPRPDLIPPVCAVTGRHQLVQPEGGDVRAPGAFIYHIRSSGGGGVSRAKVKKEARSAARQEVLKRTPTQVVKGRTAPINVSASMEDVNMKEKSGLAPASLLAWWRSFGAFSVLKKLGTGALNFGNPLFEPIPAEDAYPAGAEAGVPANYDAPLSWGKLYLFDEGSFPASANASRNLSGLKWCRGRLSQYVWLTPGSTLPSGTARDQTLEFFSGTLNCPHKGKRVKTRYALLSVEGVWINRGAVKYREGTQEEDAGLGGGSTAPPDMETPGGGGSTEPAYAAALAAFYEATRKLYYDGQVTLLGAQGNLSALLATGINISGLLPEWEHMQAPCNAVDYDPISRRATLTLGSRETLTIDELLERQNLGGVQAASRAAGDTANPLDTTPDNAGNSDSGDEDEDEEVEMIAPSINAFLATSATGKILNPFEVYSEGGKWWMNGGIVAKPDGVVRVEPVDITAHYAENRSFFARWSQKAGKVVYRYVTED